MAPSRLRVAPVTSDRAAASGRISRARNTRSSGVYHIRRASKALLTVAVSSLARNAVASYADVNRSTIPVDGDPPAWADTRPELCDALPWFRALQGGMYHNGGLCWGFLIDADSGVRSYIGDEVVITRIGGNCTKDAEGNLVLVKDHDNEHAMVSSVINSMNMKVPVGIIIGDRNTILGRSLLHRYNVMGYFIITDIWYERSGSKAGAKVRFQKLALSSKSWWAAKTSPPPLPLQKRDFDSEPEKLQCSTCGNTSSRIYREGWMCLQPTCEQFWVMDKSDSTEKLTFHPGFLNYRTRPDPTVQPHFNLVPNLLSTMSGGNADTSSLRVAWKGIVCPQCSKCISRKFWRGWKCSDDLTSTSVPLRHSCPFEIMLEMPLISLRAVIDEFELAPIKRSLFFDPKFMIPKVDDTSLFPYRKLTYNIPSVGVITHLVSNQAVNSQVKGPNDMFRDLQVADLGLRRFPLQQSVVPGTLTAHFAVNYGMPYKYVVSVDSKGFNEAPDAVTGALGRLAWATRKAVEGTGDAFLPPNEMLVLGYFEDMKIGYHDDGESSLGPTIATLSLGAKSTMLIRMKYKYYHGFSRHAKKLLGTDPVLEGCKYQKERLALKTQLEHGQITPRTYNELREKTLKKGKHLEAPPCIKMELHHGDLVVMHGENLQKYFEHSVVPEKKLRFALTARYIKPDHVEAKDLKKDQFALLPSQVYDGK